MPAAGARRRGLGRLERVRSSSRSPRELVRHQTGTSLTRVVRARARRRSAPTSTTGTRRFASSARARFFERHNLVLQASASTTASTCRSSRSTRRAAPSMRGWLEQPVPRRPPARREPRVLGAAVHASRASRSAALAFWRLRVHDVPSDTARATARMPQLPAGRQRRRLRDDSKQAATRSASRTRSASARGSTCGRSCCHSSGSILGMVSKRVTSRSISRSALLISALAAGGARGRAAAAAAPARSRATAADLVLVGGDDPHDGSGAAARDRARDRGERDRRGRRATPRSAR